MMSFDGGKFRTFGFLCFFFFLCISTTIIDQAFCQDGDGDEVDCTNRWIHIRRLPSRFNLDLLRNCSDFPLFDNFCPYLINHGLGPKTHNRSQSWYRTDPLLLEVTFHRRILDYPCLTSDPLQANVVFLPYYASIDALRYLYGADVNESMQHRFSSDFSQSGAAATRSEILQKEHDPLLVVLFRSKL